MKNMLHIGRWFRRGRFSALRPETVRTRLSLKKEWITELVDYYSKFGYTKFFMKDSLRDLMGDDFKQEFPWKVHDYEFCRGADS